MHLKGEEGKKKRNERKVGKVQPPRAHAFHWHQPECNYLHLRLVVLSAVTL
jgi:hypothetical protein